MPRMNTSNSSKCNANRQSYLGSVPEMRIRPILLIKSDLKWIYVYILVEISFYIYNSSVLKQRLYICYILEV